MKLNYQILLEEEIEKVLKLNYIPTLLLHSCCGPCSSYILEYLSSYFKITIYYYNPNIYPDLEFIRRKEEQIEVIKLINSKYPITFMDDIYNSKEYYDSIKGLEDLGEGSNRCYECYKLRMNKAALIASNNKFDYFTTTLSISPYKNSEWINEIGIELEKNYNIKYLKADFKKKNGYKRSIEFSRENDLYRQDYCGCVYSFMDNKKFKE